jgi:ribosomal-protein-alanine N-acetyltransferase
MQVRKGTPADRLAVKHILEQCPEAAQWVPETEDFLVAEEGDSPAGFLTWRRTAPDEIEILNLAVTRAFRRQGVAKALLNGLPRLETFLEVRESNAGARGLYRAAGFHEVGLRREYYKDPVEGAIVMRLQS